MRKRKRAAAKYHCCVVVKNNIFYIMQSSKYRQLAPTYAQREDRSAQRRPYKQMSSTTFFKDTGNRQIEETNPADHRQLPNMNLKYISSQPQREGQVLCEHIVANKVDWGRKNNFVEALHVKPGSFRKVSSTKVQRNPSLQPTFQPKTSFRLPLNKHEQGDEYCQTNNYTDYRPAHTDRIMGNQQHKQPLQVEEMIKNYHQFSNKLLGVKNAQVSPSLELKQTVSTLSTVRRDAHIPPSPYFKPRSVSTCKEYFNLSRNNFDTLKLLGQGKFSKVCMVRDKKTGMIAAMKSINKDRIFRQNLTNQIVRQIKISSFVSHPNIIDFYGFFIDTENVYILEQLACDGQLYKKMKQKRFSQQATSFIIRQVLQAVAYLHSRKIFHRDIKPQNIVLSHGAVKMCDLGWSVFANKNQLRETMCGTPLYASPEQIKGEKYSQKIDLWAIGILAYELYFGSIPFDIKVQQDLIRIVTDDVRFPYNADISPEFQDFIRCILKKDPCDRLSCEQLLGHPFILRYSQFETCDQVCSLDR